MVCYILSTRFAPASLAASYKLNLEKPKYTDQFRNLPHPDPRAHYIRLIDVHHTPRKAASAILVRVMGFKDL